MTITNASSDNLLAQLRAGIDPVHGGTLYNRFHPTISFSKRGGTHYRLKNDLEEITSITPWPVGQSPMAKEVVIDTFSASPSLLAEKKAELPYLSQTTPTAPEFRIQVFYNPERAGKRGMSAYAAKIEIGKPEYLLRFANLKEIRNRRDMRDWFYQTPGYKTGVPYDLAFYEELRDTLAVGDFVGTMTSPRRRKGRFHIGGKQVEGCSAVVISGLSCFVQYHSYKYVMDLNLSRYWESNPKSPKWLARTIPFRPFPI